MSTLLRLDSDTFSYICQYLKIIELATLEKCSKLILDKIRSSPQCLVSLNYQNWSLYCKSKTKDFNRLSCVKKLYLNKNIYHLMQQTNALKKIMNHLTHLTVRSLNPSTFNLPNTCPKCAQTKSDTKKIKWFNHLSTCAKCKYTDCKYNCVDKVSYKDHLINVHRDNSHCCDIQWEQCKALQSFTVYSMSLTKILQYLNYIGSDFQSLCEFAMHGVTSDLIRAFEVQLYRSHLTKLCISTTNINLRPKPTVVSNTLFTKVNDVFKDIHTRLHLFKTLRYFSCRHSVCAADDFVHLTVLCRQVITYCANLEHLELRNMRTTEYNIIFGDNIQIISKKLKQLIIHITSSQLPTLLHYLSHYNINLQLIDLLLFDRTMQFSIFFDPKRIMNNLKQFLLSQLTQKHSVLRDIKLKAEIHSTKLNEMSQWNLIQSLYLLLVDTFKNNAIQYRKELNIQLNIIYQPHTQKHRKNRMLEYDELIQLLNVLNEKIKCCTIIISFVFLSTHFIRTCDFKSLLYHLQCNHKWNVTITKFIEEKSNMRTRRYVEYRITNYYQLNTYDELNSSTFELRFNDEKDKYILCDDAHKIIAEHGSKSVKLPTFEITNKLKTERNKKLTTHKKTKPVENNDMLSIFGNNDNKDLHIEWNFDKNDNNDNNDNSNGWNWDFQWNDNENKSNDNIATWKWNLNDSDKD